ncbi:Variant-specific surface protein, partial [Giardia duodenalis]
VNDPAGVSIDSLCRPSSSPQTVTVGCTGKDGAALTDSSTACEMCSGRFFLFRGGCYSQTGTPGSEICTKAEGGRCTTCKTDTNYIFQNPATAVTLGNECILCSDANGDGTTKGVANCNKCTHTGNTGAATCSACQEGYYKDSNGACTQCNSACATCETAANTCTSCPEGKYLNGNTCVDGTSNSCGANSYADKRTWTCKACSEITGCTACAYNDDLHLPICSACDNSKVVRTELDGSTTCVDLNTECTTGGAHFKDDSTNKCLLCGDNTNGGVEHCKTCTAKGQCDSCVDGYVKTAGASTCTACGANCATCTEATKDKCDTCKPGFFLQGGTSPGTCTPCDDADSGIPGCATCTFSTSLTCSSCKPNYKASGTGSVTCTRTCDDETACGGTAGSCGAIVISASGEMTYYCSLCGDSTQIPIDGKCVDSGSANGNTCTNGACQSCAANYFLYIGGCYKADQPPGSLMCTTAEGGICTTPTGQYFAVPGATASQQSVLACGNPLGTTTGTGDTAKAYVGVEGCRTCEAPTAATGMTAAKCTACDEGKKPNLAGTGCSTCGIAGCSACRADNICEVCSDGHRLEGEACVRTGGNLSTGAIAGISVTKSSPALYR